ncbi:MAG TPA: tetratricopeptide repeat protein, partial [Candidatus Binatia bacterium]
MLREEIGPVLKRAIRLHETGCVTQAEQLYREILSLDRNVADAWNMLAVALCQQRRLDEAAKAAQRAVGLRPNIAPYWLTHGNIAVERGRQTEALLSFRRAIKLNPGFTEAHYWLARSYQREGRLSQAIESYRSALTSGSEVAEIFYHFARALLSSGRTQESLEAFEQAFARDPQGLFDRRECFERFRDLQFADSNDFWHAELIRFLQRKDVDKSRYGVAGLRVLIAKPAFRAIHAAATRDNFEPDRTNLEEVTADDLFGVLLRDTIIAQPEFELILTRLRAALLVNSPMRVQVPLQFLCDLALQSFNNEFVFAEPRSETAEVEALIRRIETDSHVHATADETLMGGVATVAMYRPLSEMSGIERFAQTIEHAGFKRLLQRTVTNVSEERKLRSVIPVDGMSDDSISHAVRAQYESNPYPRWLSFDHMPAVSPVEWLRREVPGVNSVTRVGSSIRALVAGCGTGMEALGLATQIKDSHVTAFDLSLSSLAYAQRMANEMKIKNIEFRQADILNLSALVQKETPGKSESALRNESFDVVYCVGVLMAMRDPEAGLRALLALVRPGGLLKVGVYSRRARAAVNVAREIIRTKKLPPTPSAIREFRHAIFNSAEDSPLRSLLRWRDFYSMSDCRDFLFHVQEHQFELPEIAAILQRNGLKVLGLSKQLPAPAILNFRKMFPRDQTMADVEKWQAVEQRYPETFV